MACKLSDEELKAKINLKELVIKHFNNLNEINDYCAVALEKLAMHPSSPEEDFVVDELSANAISEVKVGMLRELNSIELEDYELRTHLEDLGELEDDDSIFLVGAAATPPPGKFKQWRSYFSKRKDEPKETVAPAEPPEESKGWKRIRKVHQKLGMEYDKFKSGLKKSVSSKADSSNDEDPPSGCRPNTPVSRNAITREEIANMIREIHIIQFQARYYREEIKGFSNEYYLLEKFETDESDELMDESSSRTLEETITLLANWRASVHLMFTDLNHKLNHNKLFSDCSKLYEEKKQNDEKQAKQKSKGFFSRFVSSKKDKTPKKVKRKSGAKEDKEPLLEDPSQSPSPKRAKEEADEEVVRRLRKTSMTDDDDDKGDVLL